MAALQKPRKQDRPSAIRRRDRKKKFKELQIAVSGYGICQNCKQWKWLVGHHIISRTHETTAFEESNIATVDVFCHTDIHSLSAEKLLAKYPASPLVPEWEATHIRKHSLPLLRESGSKDH
jgi:hypothetical protein